MQAPLCWTILVSAACLLPTALGFAQGKQPSTQPSNEAAQATATKTPKDKTASGIVAVFSLHGEIGESPRGDDFLFGSLGAETLHDLVTRLKKARDDKQVKAVVLLIGRASFAVAQAEEIRRVLDEIKASGKAVYAHADSLSLRTYALAAGASRLSVVPTGDVWIAGISSEAPYVRGLLDKIGVKPDFLTCGAYKSAAEMFMRTGPSPQAAEMQNWLLDSLYETLVGLVAKGRKVPPEKVRQWIDGAPYSAERAKQAGIIDAVEFRQELTAVLKAKYGENLKFDRKYGRKKGPELDLSSPLGVLKLWAELLQGPARKPTAKDAVAIVYVEGPIVTGKADSSPFGTEGIAFSTTISKALDDAADDPSIKAVVLRIDSPGGSATGSEIILDATKRVKAKKPFVVSMGGMAGSGGYYVACGAETIYADAATITASIGVVGGKFATTGMWNKIGITWSVNRRGANAGMLSSDEVFTPAQREKLQAYMDEIYTTFRGHVSAIRAKRLKKPLDELAGGRVFTGKQALDLGLVDRIGTLDDAIRHVAQQARLKDYEVRVLPRPRNFLEVLLEDLGDREPDGKSVLVGAATAPVGPNPLWRAALPHLEGVEPKRLAAIKAVLDRMAHLQRDGVLLTMPELGLAP
ncbi:MAG: signal peptide peptidase SppA [Thermoguttaceae bacterium]|jgi:protease-4|nr:signal peptide peptidase SppA [Thermoguttaceae bacterium]